VKYDCPDGQSETVLFILNFEGGTSCVEEHFCSSLCWWSLDLRLRRMQALNL
jgi:hypothetical protein